MAITRKTELVLDRKFDPKACRHYMNGELVVLHCHHYLTLFCQLADDVEMVDGAALMAESAEDAFIPLFSKYFDQHGITSIEDRITIAEQMYTTMGMGNMDVKCAGPDSGEVELAHSHADESWIAKWGQREKAVNFITNGYVSALFSVLFGRPARSYKVSEVQSIVAGDDVSRFEVVTR